MSHEQKPLPAKLSFGFENAKLKGIHHFSLPAGHSCPGALKCWAKADRERGTITDHPLQEFRCFAVSNEAYSASVRSVRWNNYGLLVQAKTRENMAQLIIQALPKNAEIVRIHVGGDFFSQPYFDAWTDTASANPDVKFYAYTKSLPFWVARILDMPSNLHLTASRGGRFDHLIERHALKSSTVVMHPDEAAALGLELDHDDTHAHSGNEDFALLLHGGQKANSAAASALMRLTKEGVRVSYATSK